MKEFTLKKSYETIEEMLNGDEAFEFLTELKKGDIDKYAIISRIGNRYDFNGNKIEDFSENPYKKYNNAEDKNMKYLEIEKIIDNEIEKEIEKVKIQHAQEIAQIKADHDREVIALKEKHAADLVKSKDIAKAELLAKLNA